jgi:hypothetical protein
VPYSEPEAEVEASSSGWGRPGRRSGERSESAAASGSAPPRRSEPEVRPSVRMRGGEARAPAIAAGVAKLLA